MGNRLMSNSARILFFFSLFFLILTTNTAFSSAVLPFQVEREFVENRSAEMHFEVLDAESGAPIESAMVQIGSAPGEPFADNRQATDASGLANISIPQIAFDSELQVTVIAEDFPKISFMGKMDSNQVGQHIYSIYLVRHRNFSDLRTLTGEFSGWPTGISGSRAEVGLFIPSFQANTLLGFDLSNLISPRRDEMPVAGRTVNVPGNLVLPTQSKRYGFIPIRLSKPNFNMPLEAQMENRFTGVAGSLPIQEMVDLARAKDYLGVVNLIEFTNVGYTDWQTVEGNPRMPISLSTSLTQKKLKNKVSNIPAGLDLVSMGLLDPDQSLRTLVPVDIKAARSSLLMADHNMRLAFPANARSEGDAYVFNAAVEQAQFTQNPIQELNFTAALTAATWNGNKFEARESEFLPLIRLGAPDENRRVFPFALATAPELGASSMQAEFILFNLYSIKENAAEQTQLRRAIWSAILPGSAREAKLPIIEGEKHLLGANPDEAETFYWEVIAIRRILSHNGDKWDSVVSLENLRQVSHARKKLTLP